MGIFDRFSQNTAKDSNNVQPEQSIAEQTKDETELVGFVKRRVEESRVSSSRITHEGIWMTNIAYLLGFDGVFYDTTLRQFRTVSKGSRSVRRSRVHVNKILPSVQNRLSRLCKNPPQYDVRPNSSDQDDKDACRLSLQVLNMIWDVQKIDQKRISLFMWVQQCGHAFLKTSWDDQIGKPMVDPITKELDYEGDIRVDVVSPFELFVDPMAKELEDAQWVVQAKVRKLDYFKTHYPEKGELVKEEGAWLLSAQYEMRINSLNNRGQGQTGSQTIMKNSAIEIAYYEKRSKKHPNGRFIVAANGVLLADKELPVGEIPFVKFDDVKVGGKFFSESVITHARPIQDQINRIISMRASWTNKLLAGKYLAPKGSGLSQEAFNDQSGEVLEYDSVPNSAPPMALPVPAIPQYAYTEEKDLLEHLYDIFGIGEISRGQLPAAGIPAVGMQFLQEQDETRIGIVTENHEHGFARLGQLILMYASKFYITPRLLKEAGRNYEYRVQKFVGADIKDNHDVIVIKGSTLPRSKTLKRQEIINAYQQGFLGDPQDPKVREKVMGLLEYGDVGEMWDDYALDMCQVQKQITEIEQGITPIINELDNHTLHIQEKNKYRKSEKFDRLPDLIKKLLLNDIERHIQALMKIANPGLQQQVNQINQGMDQMNQLQAQKASLPPEQGAQ